MWRYFVGAAAALLLALAGMFLFRGSASTKPMLPGAPPAAQGALAMVDAPLPDVAPSASAKTREQKRFDRYDKDRNEAVSREEYLLSRRKAFIKLDTDRDGKLGFDEWAAKTTTKFAEADKDKSATLTRAEFLSTAPKHSAKPRCACGPAAQAPAKDEDD